ncbi:MAG: DNA-directed RNA polymerase subunit omega [Tissierellia bacterium]|nr:DNA-directed RNA polymerase subunit omega [Tissierellia bacterium]MDD4781500.1 DNA-directed RNA polymerase subunit omega [Tissierellia bacterium]
MRKISIDKLIDMVDSRYSLVTIIAKRARQIIDGQEVLIKTGTKKPVCIAIEEFYDEEFEAIYETEEQRRKEIENYERILEHAEREVHLSE